MAVTTHALVTTLAELDALDGDEVVRGYIETRAGDPEPGPNHSQSYHHGWRTRLMDLRVTEIPPEHHRLVHDLVTRQRGGRCRYQEVSRWCQWCGPRSSTIPRPMGGVNA